MPNHHPENQEGLAVLVVGVEVLVLVGVEVLVVVVVVVAVGGRLDFYIRQNKEYIVHMQVFKIDRLPCIFPSSYRGENGGEGD